MSALIADPDLRRRMGEAGRVRVREVFDWSGGYRRYQELWGELSARRMAVRKQPGAPGGGADRASGGLGTLAKLDLLRLGQARAQSS